MYERENRRQAGDDDTSETWPPEPLGGVVGPVQFDSAQEQLRPGTREDREDSLVRQDGSLDRGQVLEQLVSRRGHLTLS